MNLKWGCMRSVLIWFLSLHLWPNLQFYPRWKRLILLPDSAIVEIYL
uniref:Uncharacterized protein n=1 Tax=Rhizophora mucronata TaxID=61149 RepID=A0A2P2QCL8_RHIMU